MTHWFTSDEHYDHKNIIQFCKRPFSNVEEMKETLIENHNSVVKPGDIVHHAGDMFWRTMSAIDAINIVKRLYGTHYYVRGNHEELIDSCEQLRWCFNGISERATITPAGGPKKGIVLDHFGGRVWHNSDKGAWQLYGHSHNELPEIDPLLSMDIGVDANNYFPVSLEQVQEKMVAKIERINRSLGMGKFTGDFIRNAILKKE